MSPAKVERIIYIGDFAVSGNALIASDPSLRKIDMDGQVQLEPCERGSWHAFVEDDTAHTYKLIVISSKADQDLADWTILLANPLTVQTCQAGIFDKDRYSIDDWMYQKICDMTDRQHLEASADKPHLMAYAEKLEGIEGWCLEYGAVTGTATEEGEHFCYTMTNSDGIICGVAIEFYKSYTQWDEISLRKILPATAVGI